MEILKEYINYWTHQPGEPQVAFWRECNPATHRNNQLLSVWWSRFRKIDSHLGRELAILLFLITSGYLGLLFHYLFTELGHPVSCCNFPSWAHCLYRSSYSFLSFCLLSQKKRRLIPSYLPEVFSLSSFSLLSPFTLPEPRKPPYLVLPGTAALFLPPCHC